ncbi:hypothetical protein BJF78_22990 [Pseudonocardia sp. CNS-139]|nr:hypothetical protein BJF78_22990 [Pseudonocardia sp. CNS-139]
MTSWHRSGACGAPTGGGGARRIGVEHRTDDCGRHGHLRSAHAGWTLSLVVHPPGPAAEREPAHALRPRPPERVPDAVREVAHRTCTVGWQEAVAWRLSGALDDPGWGALRRRPGGLCRRLAAVARDVEDAAVLLGEPAWLGTVDGVRWRKCTRLVQKVAQAAVQKAVPWPGESRARTVAHCLLVTGVWLCAAGGGVAGHASAGLRTCACFETLARGRSAEGVRAALERHLTCLRAAPRD